MITSSPHHQLLQDADAVATIVLDCNTSELISVLSTGRIDAPNGLEACVEGCRAASGAVMQFARDMSKRKLEACGL